MSERNNYMALAGMVGTAYNHLGVDIADDVKAALRHAATVEQAVSVIAATYERAGETSLAFSLRAALAVDGKE